MSVLRAILSDFFVEKAVVVENKIFTSPNLVTVLGLIGIAFYVFQFTTETLTFLIPVTVFFVGFSDLLDGFLARQFNQHSRLGKFLDPLRDKSLGWALCLNVLLLKGWEVVIPILIWAGCDIINLFQDIWRLFWKTKMKTHTVSKIGQAFTLLSIGTVLVQEYWFYEIIPAILLLWTAAVFAIINRSYMFVPIRFVPTRSSKI